MRVFHKLLILLLVFGLVMLLACEEEDDEASSSDSGDSDDDDSAQDDDDNDDDDNDNDDDDSTQDEVQIFAKGDEVVIQNSLVRVRYQLSEGRYHIGDLSDNFVIYNAQAAVYSYVILAADKWKSGNLDYITWEESDVSNNLGEGKAITIYRGNADEFPTMVQTFTLLEGESGILADVTILNETDDAHNLGAIYTVYADEPGGFLNLGNKYALRTLTNGTLNYLDFIAPMLPGNMGALSNWSSLIYNNETEESIAIGYLTFEISEPIVFNGPMKDAPSKQKLHAVCQYEPAKTLENGESITSEMVVIDFGKKTPFDALETYADWLKAWNNIRTWLDRHPEIGVPIGWNSWSGSGSSGGYGTGINEDIIMDNMEFADEQLRRWGMNYFQIDDGWEPQVGDWTVRTDRFPDHGNENGIEWLLDQAKLKGFQTGIWMAAFNASIHSDIYANQPELFAEPLLGSLIDYGEVTLDLSKPDSRAHLVGLIEMLKEWGIQWLKLDFAYYAAMTQNWYDPSLTRAEYYRNGLKLLRQALGDDIFFLDVAVVGWNMGLADGLRLTLDTMPAWDGESPGDPITNQGLKPMYRDSIRKYFFNGRVWINHPDLIFFRAHKDTNIPPLTLNESRTFASSFALQSGLIKIGDRIVDLTGEMVDSYRRIMPVVPLYGRPLDLFEREFPEVWSVPVKDFDEPYHVIGLLNWGSNRDLTTPAYAPIADNDRVISVDFEDAGLDTAATYLAFEFWEQEYLGEYTGSFEMNVPARSPRIVAMRKKLDRPQFLGTNRHVMGGARVVSSIVWVEPDKTLTGVQEGSIGTTLAPFTHQVSIYMPSGYTSPVAQVNAPAGFEIENENLAQSGNVLTLTFDVVETTDVAAMHHPDVTWEVSFQ